VGAEKRTSSVGEHLCSGRRLELGCTVRDAAGQVPGRTAEWRLLSLGRWQLRALCVLGSFWPAEEPSDGDGGAATLGHGPAGGKEGSLPT
jgi:hypothetical protein